MTLYGKYIGILYCRSISGKAGIREGISAPAQQPTF